MRVAFVSSLFAIVAAVIPLEAHAACSVTPQAPADGSTLVSSPIFAWIGSSDCVSYRVQFSPSGTFHRDITSTPFSRRKNYSMSEAAWNSAQAGAWAAGVYWRVVGQTATGVATISTARWIDMDPDLDDDGWSQGAGDCDDANPAVNPGVSLIGPWSGTLVAPGYWNHTYVYDEVELDAVGEQITVTMALGGGESASSVDVFPPGTTILDAGYQTDSVCAIYDQGQGTTASCSFTVGTAGTYTIGVEGNWFSPQGSTNTFVLDLSGSCP